jgi:glycosyltransferase involved in cell wall biosynthesis
VGGGTRLKILDAFAAGKAVVSTSIGCEGIDINPGENILTGDSPEEFAEQVSKVLNDEPLRKKLEANARRTAVEIYSWQIIGKTLHEAYLKLAV